MASERAHSSQEETAAFRRAGELDKSRRRVEQKRRIVREIVKLSDDPRRALVRLVVLFVCVELVLIALHFLVTTQLADIAARTADGHIGGFDLGDEATLAVWFTSFQLLLLGAVCLFTSWFDDSGRAGLAHRRFWKFACFLFVFMAVDETAGLHEVFGKAMRAAMPKVAVSASMWWSVPYAAAVGLVLVFCCLRFLRRTKLLGVVAAGGVLWVLANGLEHVHSFRASVNVALEEGLEMLGATMLLAAFGSFLLELCLSPDADDVARRRRFGGECTG